MNDISKDKDYQEFFAGIKGKPSASPVFAEFLLKCLGDFQNLTGISKILGISPGFLEDF